MNNHRKLSILKLALASTFAVGTALGSVNAYAVTATSNLAVGAAVENTCTISTTPVVFGTYDVTVNSAADIDTTGGVIVTCTSGATTTVTLGQGTNPGTGSAAATPVRLMASGTNRLSYQLYSDSAGGTVWGNTGLTGVAHLGDGTATTLTVYGRVFQGQNPPAGTYADTVLATVTF